MPRKIIDQNETRRDRFKRLAEYRTRRVLDSLRVLSHCANTYQYDYTNEDVQKIFDALEREMEKAKSKFQSEKDVSTFKL
jgi:hypothetical protein